MLYNNQLRALMWCFVVGAFIASDNRYWLLSFGFLAIVKLIQDDLGERKERLNCEKV